MGPRGFTSSGVSPIGDIGGNGLTTLRRRLALLYPGQDCLDIQTGGGEVSIRLSLPPR